MLPIVDVILIVGLAGFVFYGLFFGLIRTVGAFAGVILGAIIASRVYLPVYAWIGPVFFGYSNLGKVIVFLILFTLVNRLVGFGFYLLDRTFHIIAIIPFLKSINRLGGAVLGFITGTLVFGLLIYVISRYTPFEHWLAGWLIDSKLAPMMLKVNDFLLPLLPEVMKKLKSLL